MSHTAAYQSTPRVSRGVPTGGEWRPREHGDPGIIDPTITDPWLDRLNSLRDAGYVPATTIQASQPAADPDGAGQWWDQALLTAEYGNTAGDYPQMPDDQTPSMSPGQSLSGHRRTSRVAYTGGDLTIRMPSKAAISRYATQNGPGTFDVPVSVDSPNGRPLQGWVRCTPGAAGQWDCQGLGLDGDAESYVAEGVAAVLEARHPRQALTTVGELLEARRARTLSHGTATKALNSSSWVRRVGYDKDTRTMMVDLHGTTYGYRVGPETFNLVSEAYSPGTAFNTAVKGQATKVPISNCTLCGRFTSHGNSHVCPTSVQERTDGSRNTAAWERAAELAQSATANVVAFERRPDPDKDTLLVNQPGDPRRVGVAEWMQHQVYKASIQDTHETLSNPSIFGTHVRRGFTAAIASDVEPFCDEVHSEFSYTGHYINGDQGKVDFAGLDAATAKTLYDRLPAENLQAQTAEGSPTVGNLLTVAAQHRGTVELIGSVYPPSVAEERVDVAGVLLYTATDDVLEAQRQARLMGVKASRGPSSIHRVDSPWRDGRKAWMLRW